MQQAESDRTQAQADLNAAEQGMKILGIKNPEDLAESAFFGADSGAGADRRGSRRAAGVAGASDASGPDAGFTISDMSTVWVLANVYQTDLAYVRDGDDVTVTTDAYPDMFHGKISYVSPALDPNTRTLQARIVVDNQGEKLKRDMYCTVTVTAGSMTNAIAVPDAAVLRDDENQPFVYVATGNNQFGRRAGGDRRKPERPDANHQRISAGEKVVGERQPVSAICQLRSNTEGSRAAMIHRIVQFALRQRFLILMLVVFIAWAARFRSSTCRWMPIRISRRPWSR